MGRCPTLKKEGYVSGGPVRTPLLFSRTPLAFFAVREFIFFLGEMICPLKIRQGSVHDAQ